MPRLLIASLVAIGLTLSLAYAIPEQIFQLLGSAGTALALVVLLIAAYVAWFACRMLQTRSPRSAHAMALGCVLVLVSVNAFVESVKVTAITTPSPKTFVEEFVLDVFVLPAGNRVSEYWGWPLGFDGNVAFPLVGLALGIVAFVFGMREPRRSASAKEAESSISDSEEDANPGRPKKRWTSLGSAIAYVASVLLFLVLVQWAVLIRLAIYADIDLGVY